MDAIQEMSRKIYKEYHEKLEALTVEQFEGALRQAIASGDFMTHIIKQDTGYFRGNLDNGLTVVSPLQTVDYVPYRDMNDLKMKIGRYEIALKKIANNQSPPWDKMDYQRVAREALGEQ